MRKSCKIVATLGPASDAPSRIRGLVLAGVDAIRLNFSHGSHEEHLQRIKNVRQAEELTGRPLPIIADMQGPKIRVGVLHNDAQKLSFHQEIELVCASHTDKDGTLPIPHQELFDALHAGDIIMLDDGLLRLTLLSNDGTKATARVDVPGTLTNKKGINIPGRRLPISALTEKDLKDLDFAIEQGVEYIALSFVQTAKDVADARKIVGNRAGIISKIEKPSALDELDGILDQSDAVMVARGDLGVELPLEQVPVAQRKIIRCARAKGKPAIVATQMLQSMVDSPTPTRAEASDTASAVYLGADAVMLSAESAIGNHPEATVAIMSRIIEAVEHDEFYWQEIYTGLGKAEPNSPGAIAVSARHTVDLLKCKAVLAATTTGTTAFAVSRERPRAGILGLTPNVSAARRISLAWGVQAHIVQDYENFDEIVAQAPAIAEKFCDLQSGDTILLTAGVPMGVIGGTNLMKVITIS